MASRSRLGTKLNGSRRSTSMCDSISWRASGGYAAKCSGWRSRGCMLQQLPDGLALRLAGRESHDGAQARHQVDGLHRILVQHALADAGAQRHHPRSAAGGVAGAMVLESIAPRVVIGVAPEVRKDEQSGVARI